jgi:ribosomal protein S18 acetylase RimI-like enzyme
MGNGTHHPVSRHPLEVMLVDAAVGRFPAVDGGVDLLAPDPAGTCAVVEFTGHSVVLTDLTRADLADLDLHGFGGCTHPDVLLRLADDTPAGGRRTIGSLDAVLVARARPGAALSRRGDLEDHERVRRARRQRHGVEVFGDERGLVTLGHGLVGRLEMSIERTDPASAGQGIGLALVEAGLAAAPDGELVWAQVAPGNAASMRTFLAAGFVVVGAEVLLHRRSGHDAV